jgi:hypothetical protein
MRAGLRRWRVRSAGRVGLRRRPDQASLRLHRHSKARARSRQLVCLLLVSLASGAARAQSANPVNCSLDALTASLFDTPSGGCPAPDLNLDGAGTSADVVALTGLLTAPPPSGPVVTYLGLAAANGSAITALGEEDGIPVFYRPAPFGFRLVVEGATGASGRPPGLGVFASQPDEPALRPDLQVQVERPLGGGNPKVCEGNEDPSGVPAVSPPDFSETQRVSNALNDLGCNFTAATSPTFGCTQNAFEIPAFLGIGTQVQFCAPVTGTIAFPDGDTLVTARLRDVDGNVGPLRQMRIRIGSGPPPGTFTPTPSPVPPTATPVPSPSATVTRSATPIATATRTSTATFTSVGTASPQTPLSTPSRTPTPSATASRTSTGTPSRTPSRTATASRTATPAPQGPLVTYIGIARQDDTLVAPADVEGGINVYRWNAVSQFWIVVEGAPGLNGQAVGASAYTEDSSDFPDLQIEVSQPLYDGSEGVCDRNAGGVPAIAPPDFQPSQFVINAVNDLACRFINGRGDPIGRNPTEPCTQNAFGQPGFADASSTLQFCAFITQHEAFPLGDTLVTVRLRDVLGIAGPRTQMIIRIGADTDSPTPTVSATPARTATPTFTPTRSVTPTVTPTRTATRSATPATPLGPSATRTLSSTPTASATPTRTRSATPTTPAGPSLTPTVTRTPTRTPTPTRTATRTPTPLQGPIVTFLGLATPDGVLMQPVETPATGPAVYTSRFGRAFKIVVEGAPGVNGATVGTSAYREDGLGFPDLQIEVSQPLYDGSEAVCDRNAGGVPGIDPPDFQPSQFVINAVNDFACRFVDGNGQPVGRPPIYSCVGDSFVNPTSTIQFCSADITDKEQFPFGDTLVTVRLADVSGVTGPTKQIKVRVEPPTPTDTSSPTPTVTPTRPTPASPTISRTPTRTATRTPTATPLPSGPQITAFGLTQADNTVLDPDEYDTLGRPVYIRSLGASGGASGFFIFVEAKPGLSGLAPGQRSGDQTSDGRPDFQVLPSQDLGNGSPEVCDSTPPIGGIPGFPSLDFDSATEAGTVTDILNDFECRFDNNTSLPCTRLTSDTPSAFVNKQTTTQFCTTRAVDTGERFLPVDTVLAVRWRDASGNFGPSQQIVVRVQ